MGKRNRRRHRARPADGTPGRQGHRDVPNRAQPLQGRHERRFVCVVGDGDGRVPSKCNSIRSAARTTALAVYRLDLDDLSLRERVVSKWAGLERAVVPGEPWVADAAENLVGIPQRVGCRDMETDVVLPLGRTPHRHAPPVVAARVSRIVRGAVQPFACNPLEPGSALAGPRRTVAGPHVRALLSPVRNVRRGRVVRPRRPVRARSQGTVAPRVRVVTCACIVLVAKPMFAAFVRARRGYIANGQKGGRQKKNEKEGHLDNR